MYDIRHIKLNVNLNKAFGNTFVYSFTKKKKHSFLNHFWHYPVFRWFMSCYIFLGQNSTKSNLNQSVLTDDIISHHRHLHWGNQLLCWQARSDVIPHLLLLYKQLSEVRVNSMATLVLLMLPWHLTNWKYFVKTKSNCHISDLPLFQELHFCSFYDTFLSWITGCP